MAITPSFHRYGPFTSFLRLVDLKLGCTILTLFNLFNKSAGVFGLLAIFQGGTWSQLSLYAYSLGTIFISLWGLRGISEESSPTVVLYAHCYLADHLISSIWSLYFFQVVYYYTEHNGQPPNLSPYQAGLMSLIEGIEAQYETKGDVQHHKALEGQARVEAAQQVWRSESAFSTTVLAAGWILKVSRRGQADKTRTPSQMMLTSPPPRRCVRADLLCPPPLLIRSSPATRDVPHLTA